MEEKNNLEIMIKLKDKREKEIKDNLKDEERLDTVIDDIKHLGKIKFIEEIDGEKVEQEKDIYLLIEEKDGKVLYKYYDENMELVAAEDSALELLVPSIKYQNKDQSFLKQIDEMSKDGKSLSEMEEEIEEIVKTLGINPEEIERISELDLKQEIKQQENNKQEELSKDETLNLDIKETTKLSQNVKGQTLGNKLGINNITLPNGKKLTDGEKLAVVSTSSLNKQTEKKSSQAYSFVVIRRNGQAVPIGEDILVPDERTGINPINEDLTINNDGRVNKETNITSYRIVNGYRNEFLKIGNDEVSGREIKYSEYSNKEGEYVSTELQTDRDIYINPEVRQYLKDRTEGREKANDTIDRSKEHPDNEEKDVTLVDNNPNNDSHTHINENDYIPETKITWRQFANECGYRGEGSIEKAQEKFTEETEKYGNSSNEEIVENIIEQENEDFRNPEQNH